MLRCSGLYYDVISGILLSLLLKVVAPCDISLVYKRNKKSLQTALTFPSGFLTTLVVGWANHSYIFIEHNINDNEFPFHFYFPFLLLHCSSPYSLVCLFAISFSPIEF